MCSLASLQVWPLPQSRVQPRLWYSVPYTRLVLRADTVHMHITLLGPLPCWDAVLQLLLLACTCSAAPCFMTDSLP